MSASLLGSRIIPGTTNNCRCHHRKSYNSKTIMSACVDNSCYDSEITQVVDRFLDNHVNFSRPNFPDLVTCSPLTHQEQNTSASIDGGVDRDDEMWLNIREEAHSDVEQEPILSGYYFCSILAHDSLEKALATHLATKLSNSALPCITLVEIFSGVFKEDPEIRKAIRDDLRAAKDRDPACISYVHCLLNFKGFQACQAHRVAHKLWSQGRNVLALLIQNRVSEVFAVDIHPGAKIGRGILLDHATGVVIGETAVVGDNVSILHNVTLGGTGKQSGDRHPKIGDGVLVGAGTHILGNVRVGEGAKIGAGSVVLKEVPAGTTAVGNPARLLGCKENPIKLNKLPSFTMDHTSFISDWSGYVI
ncbi:serine acetyltransferase 1, chloroplastic-like [Macadamia integrifolia]|uniref:serine acetyltransferase 1, chloroplastic-like n=1 Tax=Macadamia integrifolia TaxID=60698 RepID=UPI001C4E6839|nr:serine acetyltransferase 1, chloroplastic-like [Macadamia integrifolia]